MLSLIDLTSISLLFLTTLIIALRFPDISKIIFTALFLRFLFLIINNHIFTLPDGDMDAKSFEQFAWELSQKGFTGTLYNFTGADPYILSKMIAVLYSLVGRSILMAQSISILFGIGCVFLGWFIAQKLWDNQSAMKVGWTLALFPSVVSYSVLTMREVYISFFLLVAVLGIVSWFRDQQYKGIFLVTFGFFGASLFHGASIFGFFVFLSFIVYESIKTSIKLLISNRINLKILVFLILSLFILSQYISNKISFTYLGNFSESVTLSKIKSSINKKTKGDAGYPEWVKINSDFEIIYKVPLRMIYFVFSPFPWDVKKPSHLIGVFDSFLYITLFYLIFLNRKEIWKNPALRAILVILIAYFIIFGLGVSNFGTGIRHRSKFVFELILLAAPLIPKLTLSVKKKISLIKKT